ncbi:MAG TPA: hypothetical protein VFC85_05665 [Verrucomicrobiae bacterium]|nr:hypothetical protein [Verrucomicrobiae bacterium]
MKKLYAVKLRKTRLRLKDSPLDGRVLGFGHNTTLSFEQVIKLIAEKGISNVDVIRHDDKTPRNTRQLNKTHLLELWKAVDQFDRKKTTPN